MLPVGHDLRHPHPPSPLPSTIEYTTNPLIKASDQCHPRVLETDPLGTRCESEQGATRGRPEGSGCVQRCSEKAISFQALFRALELNKKIFSPHKQTLTVRIRRSAVPLFIDIHQCLIEFIENHCKDVSAETSARARGLQPLLLTAGESPTLKTVAMHRPFIEAHTIMRRVARAANAWRVTCPKLNRRSQTSTCAPTPLNSSRPRKARL